MKLDQTTWFCKLGEIPQTNRQKPSRKNWTWGPQVMLAGLPWKVGRGRLKFPLGEMIRGSGHAIASLHLPKRRKSGQKWPKNCQKKTPKKQREAVKSSQGSQKQEEWPEVAKRKRDKNRASRSCGSSSLVTFSSFWYICSYLYFCRIWRFRVCRSYSVFCSYL